MAYKSNRERVQTVTIFELDRLRKGFLTVQKFMKFETYRSK